MDRWLKKRFYLQHLWTVSNCLRDLCGLHMGGLGAKIDKELCPHEDSRPEVVQAISRIHQKVSNLSNSTRKCWQTLLMIKANLRFYQGQRLFVTTEMFKYFEIPEKIYYTQ